MSCVLLTVARCLPPERFWRTQLATDREEGRHGASGAWGVDASLHQTNKTGQKQGGALKIGYRETADGQVGLSGSIGYNSSSGFSTVSAGYNYDTLLGGGGYVGYTQGNTGLSPISGINSQVSWNVNAGFQSHATFEFSASQLTEALFGPSELTPEQQAIQASLANLSPEERARQKIEHGIPLDPAERAAMEAIAREGQMDAFANMGADAWAGLGYMFGGRNREEGSLLQSLFGRSGDKNLTDSEKESIANELKQIQDEIKRLNNEFSLAATNSVSEYGGDPEEFAANQKSLKMLYNRIHELTGLNVEGGTVIADYESRDEYGNKIGTAKTRFGDEILIVNDQVVFDGAIVEINNRTGKMRVIRPEHVPENSLIHINGIKNPVTDATDSLRLIKDTMNENAYLVYNQTDGFAIDVAKAAVGLLGGNVEASQDTLQKLINTGKVSTLYSHSQGTIIAGNALNSFTNSLKGIEKIESIHWVGFGSPAGDLNMPLQLNQATFYTNSDDYVGLLGMSIRSLVLIPGQSNYEFIRWNQSGHSFTNSYNQALLDSKYRKRR
jgi:hypothetical protein